MIRAVFTTFIFKTLLIGMLVILACTTAIPNDTVYVWFGNPDGSPVFASPSDTMFFDTWIKCTDGAYVADILLILATNDRYVFAEVSPAMGLIEYPFFQWDDASFFGAWHGSPPNLPGWHARTFLGFADLGQGPNPWLHFLNPTRCLRWALVLSDSLGFDGDTVECFARGTAGYLNEWSVGDTIGGPGYTLVAYFSTLIISEGRPDTCDYVLGDFNQDGFRTGGDVTFGVRYFKGIIPLPSFRCYNDSSGEYFFAPGDVNGDCRLQAYDLTRLVRYFKGIGTIEHCPWTPPRYW